jgi:plasmid stabilization system protein ParE
VISYSFHPEAEAELEDASLFYESRMPGLGRFFAAEVERTIALIREFPDAGSPAVLPRRRVNVTRFPYSVVYRHDPDFVVILAVAHQRRRPGYWKRRR